MHSGLVTVNSLLNHWYCKNYVIIVNALSVSVTMMSKLNLSCRYGQTSQIEQTLILTGGPSPPVSPLAPRAPFIPCVQDKQRAYGFCSCAQLCSLI